MFQPEECAGQIKIYVWDEKRTYGSTTLFKRLTTSGQRRYPEIVRRLGDQSGKQRTVSDVVTDFQIDLVDSRDHGPQGVKVKLMIGL